ncbi:serine/threonine-protein kinase nekl-2-like isoform X2 [Paramacrobiotus metropolitanus]|uniref:serine/threonine-protein kinase nekl-2-like isoform X2 n=1 Tax=Paramacrobiotus metropolitanus TaxID=2943436 RepID=UPI002445C078|nr:serine/threonine-protein kinase nekl-2-like isoform X2 [Paramacrobiotus metropolitanus]
MDVKSHTFGKRCRYTYEDEDYIGRGTYGIVYKAAITDPGDLTVHGPAPVAVKVVPLHKDSEVLANVESWNSWRSRMELLLTLQCDHLICYHQVSVARSSTFGGVSVKLLMDYYEDGDLASLIKTKAVEDLQTAIRYASEIADAVNHLHLKNIVHGDIKPGNILIHRLGTNNKLLLGDLDDLVQMQQSMTCSGDLSHIRGTLRYMSPEMLKKYLNLEHEKVGRKSDIWSVGCVILEMIDSAVGNINKRLYRTPDGALNADTIKKIGTLL